MSEIKKLDISKRMSQVVVYNNTIETAGIVADDTNLDIEGQTSQILDKIDSYLLKLGSHKDKILKATIWLNDMKHFDDMNSVWDFWVSKSSPPVRACVESKLASPKYLVEIQIPAAV